MKQKSRNATKMVKDALQYSNLQVKWRDKNLDRKIAFLSERLKRPLPNYAMSYELEKELVDSWCNEKSLSHLIFDLMRHMKLPFQVIKLVITAEKKPTERFQVIVDKDGNAHFADMNAEPSTAGQYVTTGFMTHEIHINMKEGYNLYTIAAIVCHEVTHHYLFSRDIRLQDTDENEQLTDIAAVYLGFGLYMLEGYKPYKIDRNITGNTMETNSFFVGYIKPDQVGYVIKKTNKLRKLSEKKALAEEKEAKKAEEIRLAQEAETEKLRIKTENMRSELQAKADTAETLLNFNIDIIEQLIKKRPDMGSDTFQRLQLNIMNNEHGVYLSPIKRYETSIGNLSLEDCEDALAKIDRICAELCANNSLFQNLL